MKIKWIIDEHILRNPHPGTPNVAEACTSLGIECLVSNPNDVKAQTSAVLEFLEEAHESQYKTPCFIFAYGSHSFVTKLEALKQYRIATYHRCDNLKLSTTIAHWGCDMLNAQCDISPFGWFSKQSPHLYNYPLFLRPNDVTKEFAGFIIPSADKFEDEMSSLKQIQKVRPETLVISNQAKTLKGEFRFVIVDRKIVTQSEYRWDNKLDIRTDVPDQCMQLAKKITKHPWQPDTAYILDIALLDGHTKQYASIIETNALSCSGLYACDTVVFVKAVNDLLEKELYSDS